MSIGSLLTVMSRSGRKLDLTPEGHTIARASSGTRLAERLLVDVIKLPWHLVHEEAGRWEHVISDDVEARLVELLGDPATCPHGIPSPAAPIESASRRAKSGVGHRFGPDMRFERLTEEVEMDGRRSATRRRRVHSRATGVGPKQKGARRHGAR